jgi:hypothetical protein
MAGRGAGALVFFLPVAASSIAIVHRLLHEMTRVRLLVGLTTLAVACVSARRPSSEVSIHGFANGLAGVRAAPSVTLRVGRDAGFPDEPVLFIDYPPPTNEPASRDVRLDAEQRNWGAARAIAFQVKPAQATRLSVSFIDRNQVVYTTWVDLHADAWQPVRLEFDDMRPNPYFQPSNARKGARLDVSDVGAIAFAPQDRAAGRLAISRFALSR